MDEHQPHAADMPDLGADATPINQRPADDELAAVSGVPVKLTVEVGQRIISIGEAADLGVGMIVPLDRQADQPLDVLINGRTLARGEVVVIDNELGVRLTEVIDADADN